jgi:GT2 family glycosyltransferase
MSVYNGERFLELAIDSILAQTHSDFEFLILDDGSSDGSADILAAYAKQDSRIRIISRENKGLVVSLNELIANAKTPIIARMDCDDIAHPERFAKQIAFLDANPDYGVVGTWIDCIDADGAILSPKGEDHPTDHDAFLSRIGTDTTLCHSSVMMRRELVNRAGGYHTAFKHCEDLDLWLRLASLTKLCSIPERLMQYRHWEAQVSNRHAYTQRLGAGISLAAYHERQAGRPDPTLDWKEMPPLDQIGNLFGRQDVMKEIRAFVVPGILYSKTAMKAQGFNLLKQYVAEGGHTENLWRTAPRLATFGEPMRAIELATLLIRRAVAA